MASLVCWATRVSSFWRKEIVEILRQPRLIVTLVLGPFLILLLFGLGYRSSARPMETLFVVPPDSDLAGYIGEQAQGIVQQLVYAGIVEQRSEALEMLRAGTVDLVIEVPSKGYDTNYRGQQAVFTFYHNEIDPVQISYIQAFARVFVGEFNRRVLRTMASEGQYSVGALQRDLHSVRQSVSQLRDALERGDQSVAGERLQALDHRLQGLESAWGSVVLVLSAVEGVVGEWNSAQALAPGDALVGLRQDVENLQTLGTEGEAALDRIRNIDQELDGLEGMLAAFEDVDPGILVSPFTTTVKSTTTVIPNVSHYYAPAVLVVLLQHLCVTFAGLSIVRERRRGTIELFQVSPLSSFEVLLGKYVSYAISASAVIVILTGLAVLVLGVPMLGSWLRYVAVVMALTFTSLGFGFVVSLLAWTTSQAVQYAMISLLASVFFSGFFLSLEMLRSPVRLISWAIPATYGVQLLQDIMLRGLPGQLRLIGILMAIGTGLFVLAWLLLRRVMTHS